MHCCDFCFIPFIIHSFYLTNKLAVSCKLHIMDLGVRLTHVSCPDAPLSVRSCLCVSAW